MNFPTGIYPVITEKFCKNKDWLKTLKAVLEGGAKIVQLREKEKSKKEILKMAEKYRALARGYKAVLIINDHIDIAMAAGADGVHLGQDDMPCIYARKIAPSMIIGVSTHNRKEALKAQKDGADYVNIGPVFPTKTKNNVYKPLGIKGIKRVSKGLKIPFTVMGGINRKNIGEASAAGAKRAALVTGITRASAPAKETKLLRRIMGED